MANQEKLLAMIGQKDFMLMVQMGLVPGFEVLEKYASRNGIENMEKEIWDAGPAELVWQLSKSILEISSTSIEDNPAGTGIGKLVIFGLDEDLNPITDLVTLDGTTVVESAIEFLFIWRAWGIDETLGNHAGLYNAGVIDIKSKNTTNVMARINKEANQKGNGQTAMSQYIVPAGHRLYIDRVHFTAGKSKEAHVKIWVQIPGLSWTMKNKFEMFQNQIPHDKFFIEILEKSKVKISGLGEVSGPVDISGSYTGLLVDDEFNPGIG